MEQQKIGSRKSLGFLPIKSVSSVCNNLFATGSNDRLSMMSPMTELSVNLELSSMSTPRRRLSLSETATPTSEHMNRAVSMESGIQIESPLAECLDIIDSPTMEIIRNRKLSSLDSFDMRRRAMVKQSFSSPVMPRKPLEPLNFNISSSPFKPIEVEENHSDLSLCEMSDQIPELEETNFRLKKRKSERSLSAPQLHEMFDDSNSLDSDCFSKASDDDGFFDEISRDAELCQFSSSVPSNFMGLFAGPIMSKDKSTSCIEISEEDKENYAPPKTSELAKPIFQKPVGLPIYGKNRSKSFSVKRDNPATDNSPSPVSRKKRPRFIRSQSFANNSVRKPLHKPFNNVQSPSISKLLHRSQSFDTHTTKSPSVDITSLLDMDDNNLIGDRSRKYCLPISDSKHPDLKGITPETMTKLLNGDYNEEIDDVHIIDCRYPYEFEGGHIKGAMNIYEKSELYNQYIKNPKLPKEKRQIFVFHCEFSSKRGPAMCRFLRNKDRDAHQHCYPQLYYPEMYLLEGGYKEYFAYNKEHCEPQLYREMSHPDFIKDLKLFSKRSKSWSGGDKREGRRRTGLRY